MNKLYTKTLGIGLFSVLCLQASAQNITPGFTSTSVCEGSTTTLNSTSTTSSGTLTSWNWDLDNDGAFDDASGASVVYIFPDSGSFPVGLEVTNSLAETESVYDNVMVSPFPLASFTASQACKGEPTVFIDNSNISSGSILPNNWDFDNDAAFDDGSGSSITHNFPMEGTYTVGLQVTSDMGCTSQVYSSTVTVNPVPNASFVYANLCTGDVTHFTASADVLTGSVTGFTWDLNDDNVFGDETGVEIDYQFPGAGYYPVTLRVTTDKGCTSEATEYVTIAALPVIIFNFSGECEGAPVQFTNQSSNQVGAITYLWDFGDASTSTLVNPAHAYASEGTYTVMLTGTSSYGCTNSGSQNITINPSPSASFTYNEVCTGFITDFVNTSQENGAVIQNYQWTFGDNDASVAENPSHQYVYGGVAYPVTLVVYSTEGCRDTATANVNVWALPAPNIEASGNLSFCSGGSVDLSVDLEAGQSAIWSNAQTTATITVTESGMYIVNIYDEHGCQQRDTINVVTWDLPVINVSNDTTVSLGYDVQLWATGAVDYEWEPETYLDNHHVANPVAVSPLETITYTVTGTDANGCQNTADVTITVLPDYTLETVNLFTPNGDGVNDVWRVKNLNLYEDCQVNVYNRWGVEVFSATDYQNNWDGTHDGQNLPEATYYYIIKCNGTDKEYDGAISILRHSN